VALPWEVDYPGVMFLLKLTGALTVRSNVDEAVGAVCLRCDIQVSILGGQPGQWPLPELPLSYKVSTILIVREVTDPASSLQQRPSEF
jgi:hypothetical protein